MIWDSWLVLALGLPMSFVQITVIILLVFLVTIIPISIGGWGVRETAMVAPLGQVGVANADALLCSVLFGLAQVLASLPGLSLLWWEPLASLKPERDIDRARA
jgi:uncharacterized membrane protein YbhN (UPF0104 family)